MSFTIVLDGYLDESVTEYGAILDLELKDAEHSHQTKFEALLKEDDKQELLALIVDSAKELISNFSDRSLEPTYNLYLHILDMLTGELDVELTSILNSVLENLGADSYSAANSDAKPTTVISILSNTFNFLPEDSHIRVLLLQQVLKIAAENGLENLLVPLSKNLGLWLAEVDSITADEWRQLVNTTFNVIYAKDSQTAALDFYKKVIESSKGKEFLEAEDYDNFVLKALAAKQYFNVANLPIAAKLGDSSVKELFTLLQNAETEKLSAFQPSGPLAEIPNLSYKVKYPVLVSSLEKLEQDSGSSEFSYSEVAAAVDVPVEEIEEFLIDSIQQGLVDGRLSQVAEKFYLSRIDRLSTPTRGLDAADWERVNKYLGDWSATIEDTQSLVENLITRKGKKMLPPQAIQVFHQQKQEAKEEKQRQRQAEAEAKAAAAAAAATAAAAAAAEEGSATEAEVAA